MDADMCRTTKVAIVHDWLTRPGGAERVLQQMLLAFPEADLYTLVDAMEPEHRHLLEGRTPVTSFLQRLPFAKRKHWLYLPLMPLAVEQFDLSRYDLVLSSSYCAAKGVLTGPEQTHLSYIHTPVRYAWHLQHQYLREMGLTKSLAGAFVRAALHYLRLWDLRSTGNVDSLVANSHYVGRQVERLYRRKCAVLPPPCDLDRFSLQPEKEAYYVTASRMVPYKRIDLIVRSFARMPQRRLLVVGDGPEMKRIRAAAQGHSNIEILGYQPDEPYRRIVSRARAFVFAAIEDFGISTVEAQAAGTPVICLARGGSREIVRPLGADRPTGVHFEEQTEEAVIEAVNTFERFPGEITPGNCRRNVERYSTERFHRGLKALVSRAMAERQGAPPHDVRVPSAVLPVLVAPQKERPATEARFPNAVASAH